MEPQFVQMLGLLLDVVGFALIYFYGVHRSGATEAGSSGFVIRFPGPEDPNAPAEADLKRWINLSRLGFGLVTLGFITQGIGLNMSL